MMYIQRSNLHNQLSRKSKCLSNSPTTIASQSFCGSDKIKLNPPIIRFKSNETSELPKKLPAILTQAPNSLISWWGPAVHPDFAKIVSNVLRQEWQGYDSGHFTKHAERETFPKAFGKPTVVTFCTTLTAANLLCFDADIVSGESVVVADTSHINRYELAGIEVIHPGVKVEAIPSVKITGSRDFGKITSQAFKQYLEEKEKNPTSHRARILSITNPTEYGTLYTPKEIKKLVVMAHKADMLVHLDGARLFNWEAITGKPLKALTTDLGIDMLSLGGSKSGMLHAEAAVFLPDYFKHARSMQRLGNEANKRLKEQLTHRKVQLGQRVGYAEDIPAQFILGMESNLAVKVSQQALQNAQTFWKQLEPILKELPKAHLVVPVESNAVVVSVPKKLVQDLGYEMQKCGIDNPDPEQETILYTLRFGTPPEAMTRDINDIRQWAASQQAGS